MLGDHIRALKGDRWLHGIDLGDQRVLYLQEQPGLAPGDRLRRVYRPEFTAGASKVELVLHRERNYPAKSVVARAWSRFMDPSVVAMFRDSEAFAAWCKIGRLPEALATEQTPTSAPPRPAAAVAEPAARAARPTKAKAPPAARAAKVAAPVKPAARPAPAARRKPAGKSKPATAKAASRRPAVKKPAAKAKAKKGPVRRPAARPAPRKAAAKARPARKAAPKKKGRR